MRIGSLFLCVAYCVFYTSAETCEPGYQAGQAPCELSDDGLVLAYEFDDPTNIGLDSSPNGYDGTPVGVVLDSEDAPEGESSAGLSNTNYVTIPSLYLNFDVLTIAFWLKVDLTQTNNDNWQRIFRLLKTDTVSSITCGFYGNVPPGSLFFWVGDSTTRSQVDAHGSTGTGNNKKADFRIQNNVWYHITWTLNSVASEWTISVTGYETLHSTGMVTHKHAVYGSNIINHNNMQHHIVGKVDNFRIYASALSPSDIESVRSKGMIMDCENTSTPCIECMPGYHSPIGTACIPCLPGYYAPDAHMITCLACAEQSHSFKGGTSCFDLDAFLDRTGCSCIAANDAIGTKSSE